MDHEKPFAITLDVGSSLANKTGAWRTERPVYLDLLPPCNQACPAGENIQQWLYHAEDGGYESAWRQIMADNPFPAVMGRVCYRPCETACNRGQLDESVGINSVERFLGDEAIRGGWTVPVTASATGRRVLIVGAGPAGLSAAYHLRLLGHDVTVRDAGEAPGGMMRYGIPRYRLPREVLDAEIDRILAMGVQLELRCHVKDVVAALAEFDAVFLAVGAHIAKRAYLPAGDSARILDAVSLLHDVADTEPPMLGRRVVVYGGGNTAMDAARTAKRLGATDAVVVYRRTRDRMPAHDIEVTEATDEGVTMKWLSTIARADGDHVTVEKMRLDDKGFPQPTGEFEELAADTVVLALGQEADLALLEGVSGIETEDGVVRVGPNLMTGHPGIFAGGDMVPSDRTVTIAIGHGKNAARQIDSWLRHGDYHAPKPAQLASYDKLNTWYFSDAHATVRPELEA
ncbi:MAG TPA: NAD(P)-binding protein, partial [Kutzneria sp.]|nr:NAD(P)-binding protein [Kutzneria sp.]